MLAEKLPEIETVPKIMVHYINMVRASFFFVVVVVEVERGVMVLVLL